MMTNAGRELLADALPAVIETDEQYEQIGKRYGELLGKGRSRAPEETKLMRLLGLLLEDYDRRTGMPPDDSTPAEILHFLLEHSGKAAADLEPVFGERVMWMKCSRGIGRPLIRRASSGTCSV